MANETIDFRITRKSFTDISIIFASILSSLVIGGWISKELIYTSREHIPPAKTLQRALLLILLSLLALAIHLILRLVPHNYTIFNFQASYFINFAWIFIRFFWIICVFQSIRYFFKTDLFLAFQWLLPLTTIIFLGIMGSHWEKTQYIQARIEFYFKEKNLTQEVERIPIEKNGLPKLIVFNWGGSNQSARLLIYDESDDLADKNSLHRRLFDVWPPVAAGVVILPHTMKSIYQVHSRNIKGHFYLVIIDYGEQPIESKIN